MSQHANETELRLAAVRAEREALRIQLEQEREAHKATREQRDVFRSAMDEFRRTDDEVRAFIAKCQSEQGKAFCAFCGEVTERADIASHISACAAHPMRAVEQERDEALDCGATGGEEACGWCIACLRADAARMERERDFLRAQLAALQAEHEEAAKVTALHFERIAAFAADAADFSDEGVGGPLLQIEGMARAALALAEVQR